MSALKADMCSATRYVRFVPIADIRPAVAFRGLDPPTAGASPNIEWSKRSSRRVILGCGVLYPKRQGQNHPYLRAGKEAVVAVMGPDEFSGEGCLNGQMAFVIIKRLLAIVGRNLLRAEKPPQPYKRDLN